MAAAHLCSDVYRAGCECNSECDSKKNAADGKDGGHAEMVCSRDICVRCYRSSTLGLFAQHQICSTVNCWQGASVVGRGKVAVSVCSMNQVDSLSCRKSFQELQVCRQPDACTGISSLVTTATLPVHGVHLHMCQHVRPELHVDEALFSKMPAQPVMPAEHGLLCHSSPHETRIRLLA